MNLARGMETGRNPKFAPGKGSIDYKCRSLGSDNFRWVMSVFWGFVSVRILKEVGTKTKTDVWEIYWCITYLSSSHNQISDESNLRNGRFILLTIHGGAVPHGRENMAGVKLVNQESESEQEWGMTKNLWGFCSDWLSPARFNLPLIPNLPIQPHSLGTRCSDTWAYEEHFRIRPQWLIT